MGGGRRVEGSYRVIWRGGEKGGGQLQGDGGGGRRVAVVKTAVQHWSPHL